MTLTAWRRFFPQALLFLAALYCAAPVPHRASADEPFRVILISDTHLGFKKSNEAFQAFLKDVPTLPFKPKYLINNGDIAEMGNEEIFKHYNDAIHSLDISPFNVIGNHDTRWSPIGKNLFARQIGPLYFSKDLEGIHWMFLDSTLEHQTQGHIDWAEMSWITEDLKKVPADEPIFVFSHHPLKWRGMSIDDGLETLNLFENKRLAALFNGHGHRLENVTFRGIPFIENDALFNGHYLILEKSGNQVKLYVKTLGDPELKPWVDINLHPAPPETPWGADETKVFAPGPILAALIGEVYAGLAADSRSVFAGTLDGTLYAVSPHAKIRWRTKLDDGILAAPFADGKTVYAATRGGTLYAVRAVNGTVLWKVKKEGAFAGAPYRFGDTVFVGCGDGNLYAFDAGTGKERWRTSIGAFTEMQPVVDRGIVFIGSWNHAFYAIDAQEGRILWKKNIGKAEYYSPSVARPVVSDGVVYVTAKDHHVYALDEKTGSRKWTADTNDTFSSPLLLDDSLILAGTDGHVTALDLKTGKPLWTKELHAEFYSASPIAQGRRLYLVDVEGHYFNLNTKDQTVEGSFRVSKGWNFGTPVILGGSLWIGSLDGHLYGVPLK